MFNHHFYINYKTLIDILGYLKKRNLKFNLEYINSENVNSDLNYSEINEKVDKRQK